MIVKYPNKCLVTPCEPVKPEEFAPIGSAPNDLLFLISRMKTVCDLEKGVGLAANQIGVNKQVFVMNRGNPQTEFLIDQFINPEIIEYGDKLVVDNEACLSLPGLKIGKERDTYVVLKWQDTEGLWHEEGFKDLQAICIQHEVDHLNGKTIICDFGPLKRKMIVEKLKKVAKKNERVGKKRYRLEMNMDAMEEALAEAEAELNEETLSALNKEK